MSQKPPASSTNTNSKSIPTSQEKKLRTIPPLVLLSFALLHSQVYWLYSVIYHICHNIPDRPLDLSFDDSFLPSLQSGRARALSEPQSSSSAIVQHRHQSVTTVTKQSDNNNNNNQSIKRRPRSTTISATTVDADYPLRRQQWVKQLYDCLDDEQKKVDNNIDLTMMKRQQPLMNSPSPPSYILDEKLGRTKPPRWWQITKKHLVRTIHHHHDQDITSSTSSSDNDDLVYNHQQPSSSGNGVLSAITLPTHHSKKLIESITTPSSSTTTSTTISSSTNNNSKSNNNTKLSTTITNHLPFVLPSSSNLKSNDQSSQKLITEDKTPTKKLIPMIKSLSTSTTHSSSSSTNNHHQNENKISLKKVLSNDKQQHETVPDNTITATNAVATTNEDLLNTNIKQKRALNRIKSVFVKSQIESELSHQDQQHHDLSPKRKTILGIPSRWKSQVSSTTSLSQQEKEGENENQENESTIQPIPPSSKIQNSLCINEPITTDSDLTSTNTKKRMFNSLPVWKRKSYR
ncbi:hypothetical protein BJ944DRAFT_250947 [Cunninghamella echinulata]|nr:hypothetical protein BJ944DRAFT_250947 [Cunninghamella echinulata]